MTNVDRDSEFTLVDGLRHGEPGAIDEVHRQFNGRLFTFLVRLSRSRDVAEDLLEETWLRCITHAAGLRPDTHLARWLFTIARNLYISHCRSRLLEAEHASDLIGLWPYGTRRPSPFEEASAIETERRIEGALASLPVAYREVLLLVGVAGLPPIDAAAVCGLSSEAVRQRLHRARALLARRLERSGDSPLGITREVPI